MSRSDAPREQLLKPWHLLVAVVGFIAAFVWIAPARQSLSLKDASSGSAISELDVAYVKAQRASNPQTSDDLIRAASALVRARRVDEADALLAGRPDVQLLAEDELTLELERAYSRLNSEVEAAAPDQARLNQYRNAVVLALQKIVGNSNGHRLELLERARGIAISQSERRLAGELSKHLALADSNKANHWYRDCAEIYRHIGELSAALDCASLSVSAATSEEQRFDSQVLEFTLASAFGDRPRANVLATELLDSKSASVEGMAGLAEHFLAAERPADAARTYAKLVSRDTKNGIIWARRASRWAQASGNSAEAAVYLDMIRTQVPVDELSALDDEIARLLVAAGDSMALLNRYQTKIADGDKSEETLTKAITAAVGSGDTESAASWNQLLVQNYPESIAAWMNQYSLSLGAGNLPAALSAAKTLVDLEPKEVEHHARLAQVAEWSGDPDLATAQWLWVNERQPTSDSLAQLIRLSRLTFRPAVTAEALRQKMMLTKPNAKELEELIAAYELEGIPKVAASVIEELIMRHGNDSHQMMRLAHLHQYHTDFDSANKVWQRYEGVYGKAVVSQLYRMELEWRMGRSEIAEGIVAEIPSMVNGDARGLNDATDFQITLLADLAWRNELSEVTNLVIPQLDRLEDKARQYTERKRSIEIALKSGDFEQAIASAEKLVADTNSSDAKLLHMRIINAAMPTSDNPDRYDHVMNTYLTKSSDNSELRESNLYWSLVAQYHLSKGDQVSAAAAYRSVLSVSPRDPNALAGMLWMHIGDGDTSAIKAFIETYESFAEETPALWTAFGIAYMQIGLPARSLTWFERQIDIIEADYSLLLTYADMLEAVGRTEDALKVRHYAIDALRPLLAEGIAEDQDILLQQYARMVAKFGSSDQKERFMLGVMEPSSDTPISKDKFWQQEMAISWLMATQRQDLARVILAKLHQQRLEAPAWQALAVAMKQNDLDVVAQIVQKGQGISVGDNMLALRRLGRENDAYSMAVNALQSGLSGSDGQMAAETYRSLREYRPGFAGASVLSTNSPFIDVIKSGVLARHTFAGTTLGISVDASFSQFDSDRYRVSDDDDRTDLAVTLHHGDAGFNSRLTAGYIADGESDRSYFSGGISGRFSKDKHGYDLELATNETSDASTLLNLRAKQNRASGNVDLSIGAMGFLRFSADYTDISTRISERKVARGISGVVEVGVRGSIGSHSWSGSIAASTAEYDRTDEVPEELELNNEVTIDEVIGDSASTASIGVSLSRGNVAGNYPQVSSPRYFLNARAGQRWPENSFGLQFDAGAGMRILGGDELSIGFSHDGLVTDIVDEGTSRFGLNYRYHF